MKRNTVSRDSFSSKWGFILACIGSAVGMGNIWLFPRRVDAFGAPFLVAYVLCVILLGFAGSVGEMSFGRAMKSGPMGAFEKATESAGAGKTIGSVLSMIPVLGSFALAIGYSVVVGWILKCMVTSITGSLYKESDYFTHFVTMASEHNIVWWHIAALVICFLIVVFGISSGIEKVNKVMMPLFFVLFIGIAVYVSTISGAVNGYKHMFVVSDWSNLLDPSMWKFALGQAFFSLSLAGGGTLVYGSYLKDNENVPSCAMTVAVFDTLAAFVASLAIIPAVYAFGINTNESGMGGPGLMFVSLPEVFKSMPMGNIVMIIFFVAVFFAGITSLVNLFEAPIEALQTKFKLSRISYVAIVAVIGTFIAVLIEAIVSDWMDICSIYICPVGALLAAVMFFWVCKKDFAVAAINKGSKKQLGNLLYNAGKYVFCIVTVLVLILGATTSGGIG